jgi:hypothetical protein
MELKSNSNWNKGLDIIDAAETGTNVKRQGRAMPGIDYGDTIVARKKNVDDESGGDDASDNIFNGSDHSRSHHSRADFTRNSDYGRNNDTRSENIGYQKSESPSIFNDNDTFKNLKSTKESNYTNGPAAGNSNDFFNNNNFMGNNFETSNAEEDASVYSVPKPKLSFQEVQKRKEELLAKLARLEAKGFRPIKIYSLTSELSEIEEAYNKTNYQYNCDKSVKLMGKGLVFVVAIIEKLNTTFDPLGIYLEGWSEAVFEDLDSYQDIFEELYDIYKDQLDYFRPEFRLIGMVAMSGIMYHYSHAVIAKAAGSMPDFSNIMNNNPELKKAYVNAAANSTANDNSNKSNNPLSNMMNMAKSFLFNNKPESKTKTDNKTRNVKQRTGMNNKKNNYEDDILGGFKSNDSDPIDISELDDVEDLSDE